MPANEIVDLQPDNLEAMQAEEVGPAPKVVVTVEKIETPVRTQELPRKAGSTRTQAVAATLPGKRILTPDHRRASCTLIAYGGDMLFAHTEAAAGDASTMCRWPQSVPLILSSDAGIWVAGATVPITLSFVNEFWAVDR